MVGDRVHLPCNITIPSKDDSITLILWYRGDTTGAPIYTLDARQVQAKQTKHFLSDDLINRASLNITVRPAILTIEHVRGEDEGEYRCRVDFRWGRTMNTVISLVVIVPPRKVIIKNEKLEPLESLAGPYDEDSDVLLICEAKGARPPAVVQWFRDKVMIDESHEIIQDGARVRNQLIVHKVNRNDLHVMFRCQAFNTNASIPVESKVMLDINLRPLTVEILSTNQPLIAGRKIDVICQSTGSRPAAIIAWYRNRKKLTHSRENFLDVGNITRSVITLTPVPDDNGSQLICTAENTRIPNSTIQDMWTLNVQYEPKVSLVMTTNHKMSIVAEGNEVLMDCKTKANPPVFDHTFYYDERMIKPDQFKGVVIKNSTLAIKKVNRYNNGKYFCLANNLIGRGKSNDLILTVDYAPICKSGQKIVYGIGIGETAKVLCDVDARPTQVHFHWTLNNTHNQNLKFISEGLRSSLSYTPKDKDDYGFVSCFAKNVVGSQQVPCVYTLIPAGRPEPVTKCSASNHDLTSFLINCDPGYDGGLQQSFALELYHKTDGKLVINLTDSVNSVFKLSGLQSDTEYEIKVFSVNVKGKSDYYSYLTKTTAPPKKLEEPPELTDENDFIHHLVIIAIILILIAFLIGIICKFMQKCNNKLFECDNEEENKSEEIIGYVDDLKSGRVVHNQNGILPQDFRQSNKTLASKYSNDSLSRRIHFDRHHCEDDETDSHDRYDDEYNDTNYLNNCSEMPFKHEDCYQWSNASSESNPIEVSYGSDSIQLHIKPYVGHNFSNNNIKCARKILKSSYTSTPV